MARKPKNMIVKVVFGDKVMMFGNSYRNWDDQAGEFMRMCAEGLEEPTGVMVSNEPWVAWGGLKWCPESDFQHQLNREGCQSSDPDNPHPRKYADMRFEGADTKVFQKVMSMYQSGQRLLRVGKLSAEDYKLYLQGELVV